SNSSGCCGHRCTMLLDAVENLGRERGVLRVCDTRFRVCEGALFLVAPGDWNPRGKYAQHLCLRWPLWKAFARDLNPKARLWPRVAIRRARLGRCLDSCSVKGSESRLMCASDLKKRAGVRRVAGLVQCTRGFRWSIRRPP